MPATGTPAAAIDRVHRDTVKVLAMPDVAARLTGIGMAGVGNSPAELAQAVDAESRVWAEVIRTRKLRAK